MEMNEAVKRGLEEMGITRLTDMQEKVLQHSQAGDILVQSPTGSGKTLAYLLPVLRQIELQGKGKHFPAVLILAPTRELCLQIGEVIRKVLKYQEGIRTLVLCGGSDMNRQIRSASKGADIVIGTPARIKDHLRRHTFKPKNCHMLVLDEADDLLSMGFIEDVESIISSLPLERRMLFSATYTDDVQKLAARILIDPFIFQTKEESLSACAYRAYLIDETKKPDLLKKLIKNKGHVLVFTNKRNTADYVSSIVNKAGTACGSIHSEMDMKERKRLMDSFRKGGLSVLCATEVAARGIDLSSLSLLICYDLPLSMEDLVHRFGRAGRLNHQAEVSLFLTPDEKTAIIQIKKIYPDLQVIRNERSH